MDELIMNEQILNDAALREKLIGHYEVLDKVKNLLLIPNTDFITIKQVATYYEVDIETVKKTYQRNKDEFQSDGVCIKKYKEILMGHNVPLENIDGKYVIRLENGKTVEIPNRGINIFPRRAILRMGMLLRDSPVAKEVRNQLLNIEEVTTNTQKIQSINEEQELMLDVGKAMLAGDVIALATASTRLMEFKNRHIEKLEQENAVLQSDNDILAKEILTWTDRSKLNFGIRKLSKVTGIHYSKLWNELYKQLKYKYSIDVKARAKKDYIKTIREDEWKRVTKSFAAICNSYNQSPTEMLDETKQNNK